MEFAYDAVSWICGLLAAAWMTRDLARTPFTPLTLVTDVAVICLLSATAGLLAGLYRGRYQRGSMDEVMGVGMALFEHTSYDEHTGAPINSNLADYIMASHADTPALDVTFLDHPDMIFNELGARGIAEIGLAGIAAAITNAVHHATGIRVRRLPVMIEDFLNGAA